MTMEKMQVLRPSSILCAYVPDTYPKMSENCFKKSHFVLKNSLKNLSSKLEFLNFLSKNSLYDGKRKRFARIIE